MKLYLQPRIDRPDKADGGIRRVIDAQVKYLPEFGVELTTDPAKADITAGHGTIAPIIQGKPFVTHNHGMYWSDYQWTHGEEAVNQDIVECLVQAQAITVPSKWVRHALTRGLLRNPKVIYHGVDATEWKPQGAGKYVLWNKARADVVSDPRDLVKIASRMPRTSFISTIGNPTTNVTLCGVVPFNKHKQIIEGAGVYLATARETFGIGTLEAMASGVPIAGWDYGGQHEIVIPGETGYLAPFGDYDALEECIQKCFAERERLSANARADVLARWQWKDKIEQYAELYRDTVRTWNAVPKVSVIITAHNYGKFLKDCLASVAGQSMADFECIIVDDASSDNTPELAQTFAAQDKRFSYVRPETNLKLSGARNLGRELSNGKYIIHLDADDTMAENALGLLSSELDKRHDVHIVYGGLDTMSADGTGRQVNSFPGQFSWYAQMAHLNQLHYSAMIRREALEISGGYRVRQWRAEDAEMWCRLSSYGFRIEKVTTEPTVIYRWHGDNKSAQESKEFPDRDGDWCELFPWRTARTGAEGHEVTKKNPRYYTNQSLVPFGAQGRPIDRSAWFIWHHAEPLVSVIIPVGPGHEKLVVDALDSLIGQTMGEWEAVVVNDTGKPLKLPPFARLVETKGHTGAGAARNAGIDHARAKLVYFLDADDMLVPGALLKTISRYANGEAGYIYSDTQVPSSLTATRHLPTQEYSQAAFLKRGVHSQAVLMATADAKRIRFNETLDAWEDWDFFLRCAIEGVCGERLPEAVLIYRKHLGKRSEAAQIKNEQLYQDLRGRYNDYVTGANKMGKCCGGNAPAVKSIQGSRTMSTRINTLDAPIPAGHVRMKYIGARTAPITYYSNGRPYPAAQTDKWKHVDALADDVSGLVATGQFVILAAAPIPTATVIPMPAARPPQEIEAERQARESAERKAALMAVAPEPIAVLDTPSVTVPVAVKKAKKKRG